MSDAGRHRGGHTPSLAEVHGSVKVPPQLRFWRRLVAFSGPAYLVSVGYMDPGNWATDIAAGSQFGYALLWVLLMSNLMAILLQSLSARLGIVTGMDLAQACRAMFGRRVAIALWVLCEIAIAACDLAEVLGSAIGLQLLFGIPLVAGVLITALDTFLLLLLHGRGIRKHGGVHRRPGHDHRRLPRRRDLPRRGPTWGAIAARPGARRCPGRARSTSRSASSAPP